MVDDLRVFRHVGFFLLLQSVGAIRVTTETDPSRATIAEQIGHAASAFELLRTGHRPKSVTVVLREETLLITLHDALSPADKELLKSPPGAARMREFHGHLFATSSESLREKVKRITSEEVREATTETATGTVVHILMLARNLPMDIWSGSARDDLP